MQCGRKYELSECARALPRPVHCEGGDSGPLPSVRDAWRMCVAGRAAAALTAAAAVGALLRLLSAGGKTTCGVRAVCARSHFARRCRDKRLLRGAEEAKVGEPPAAAFPPAVWESERAAGPPKVESISNDHSPCPPPTAARSPAKLGSFLASSRSLQTGFPASSTST